MMQHIHRALLALQLTHALHITTAPPLRRRRPHAARHSKLTSDYVESLFDGFADTFEGVLVDQLEYIAPAKVAEAAKNRTAVRGTKYASALDAGCGTGLAGPELRDAVRGPVDGVDLSAKMAEYAAELCVTDDGGLERAEAATRKATGWETVYRRVETGNLLKLDDCDLDKKYELVVLADVLCYFGDLSDVLEALAKKTAPGGDLIFTVETLNEGDWRWVLQSIERYAHHPDYVRDVATALGLEPRDAIHFQPRMESGLPVRGTLHVMHKPSS
jgi:predicted TPR repeat methyltransferase